MYLNLVLNTESIECEKERWYLVGGLKHWAYSRYFI